MRKIILTTALLAAACSHQGAGRTADSETAHFFCTGTEPFWSLELKEGEAILNVVGMAPGPDRTAFDGGWARVDESAGRYDWRGADPNGGGFNVTVTRAACQGTRDEPYAYKSSYGTTRANGQVEPGCCVRRG